MRMICAYCHTFMRSIHPLYDNRKCLGVCSVCKLALKAEVDEDIRRLLHHKIDRKED